ncbi:MAG TPA: hypothetical protein DCE11_03615 [Ruminiclostridium sp.]|nr:hypothetical protein [Clostridiaceae bacterium]HAA25195.1 hypothetical protein [Ruminiclostridium sp.]
MAVVYFYVPIDKLEDIIDCGLKLSEWKESYQSTPWNRVEKPCFSAFLHPLDDEKHKDRSYRCIKLDIEAEYCAVYDSDLYRISNEFPELKEKFFKSMVPLNGYIFGSIRRPQCFVFTTVLSEQISLLGKSMDEPILYENSEILYVNNILQQLNDRYTEFNSVLLYSFLAAQEQNGVYRCYRSTNDNIAVFFDEGSNEYISVPIPDYRKYNEIKEVLRLHGRQVPGTDGGEKLPQK